MPKLKKKKKPEQKEFWETGIKYGAWTLALVVVAVVVVVRIRLLGIPLERDEGEYAYSGQLILRGLPPYLLAYNMKFPGTGAAYAVIMALFGQTPEGIRLGLLVINIATVYLVYLLARRLFDWRTGMLAASAYAVLSVGEPVLGVFGHATHFVLLPAMAGLILALKAMDSGKVSTFFWSGFLLGVAYIMKQQGVAFAFFAMFFLLWSQLRERKFPPRLFMRRFALFLLGVSLPFGLTCLALLAFGVFPAFWFWTFEYGKEYASDISLSQGLNNLAYVSGPLVTHACAVWILAGLGIIFVYLDKKARGAAQFMFGLTVFSLLATCPGLHFCEHYFVLILPAVAILCAVSVRSAGHFIPRGKSSLALALLPEILLFIALGLSAFQQRQYLFLMPQREICRTIYGSNPFIEAVEIGKYIRTHSAENARIAVIGSEPEIYFYSRRLSATGHIYMYGLMEKHEYALKMQKQMIKEIEKTQPEYLVFVDASVSWLRHKESEKLVLDWFKSYYQQFDLVGVADILSSKHTEYRWGDDAARYKARSKYHLYVFRRRALQ